MKSEIFEFGPRLRALRLQRYRSQQAFADHCQTLGLPVTRDMMANWETNRADMPAQLIPFVARALNAQVTDLLPDLRIPSPYGFGILFQRDAEETCLSKPNKANAREIRRSQFDTPFVPPQTHCPRTPTNPIFEARGETSPLDALVMAETRTTLMAMIRTLDHRHREVLLLYFYSGLKVAQIAAKLNLPTSNISARLYRACEKLRRLMCCNSQWRKLRQEFQDRFPRAEMS